jgi:hypothetical protein
VPDSFVTCTAGCVTVAASINSGVDSFVGRDGVGVKTAAVNVNCDTTVLAAEVRTAATSGVDSAGVAADPQAAIKAAIIAAVTRIFGFMEPPVIGDLIS